MLSQAPIFIIDSDEESAGRVSSAFRKAQIQNAIHRFNDVPEAFANWRGADEIPVIVAIQVKSLGSHLAELEGRFQLSSGGNIPLVIYGPPTEVGAYSPRAILEFPPKFEELIQALNACGISWLLQTN